jgi:hypothetical protein
MKYLNRAKIIVVPLCCIVISVYACKKDTGVEPEKSNLELTIITSSLINDNYGGNGAQWGGYEIYDGYTGGAMVDQQDWPKLKKRVDFMRPGILRIMVSYNYYTDNYSEKSTNLIKILDYCQENGIKVVFGDWGNSEGTLPLDEDWIKKAVNYLDWLVNANGYDCIEYYNLINEPNGDWSSAEGNYAAWEAVIKKFHEFAQAKGLKVKIIGPDIAFWDKASAQKYMYWVTNTIDNLSDEVGAFDIHAYPGQTDVRNNEFSLDLTSYRNSIPGTYDVFVTELGGKFSNEPELKNENEQRIQKMPNTSVQSNMFIYDAFYAIDMADAIIQCMNAGYSGVIVWEMDDAMYGDYNNGTRLLKRWGFWNTLGEEGLGGATDENIRPWFYTVSLLSRYFPRGAKIYSVISPDDRIKAVAAELNGKYSLAIVNSSYKTFEGLQIKFENNEKLSNIKIFQFSVDKESIKTGQKFIGTVDSDGFATPVVTEPYIDFGEGYDLPEIEALTFTLITNID